MGKKGPKRQPKSARRIQAEETGRERTWIKNPGVEPEHVSFLCSACLLEFGRITEVKVNKRGGMFGLCESCEQGTPHRAELFAELFNFGE